MNSEVRISWRWPVKKHRGRMVEGLYSDKGMQICTLQVTGDCWRILSWRVIWWTMHLKPFRHDCERWNKRDWKEGDQLDHCWFQGHWCVFFFFFKPPLILSGVQRSMAYFPFPRWRNQNLQSKSGFSSSHRRLFPPRLPNSPETGLIWNDKVSPPDY